MEDGVDIALRYCFDNVSAISFAPVPIPQKYDSSKIHLMTPVKQSIGGGEKDCTPFETIVDCST